MAAVVGGLEVRALEPWTGLILLCDGNLLPSAPVDPTVPTYQPDVDFSDDMFHFFSRFDDGKPEEQPEQQPKQQPEAAAPAKRDVVFRLNPLGSKATQADTVVEVRQRQADFFHVPPSSIDMTMVNSKGHLAKVLDHRNIDILSEDEDGEEQTLADVLMSGRGPEESLETVLEEVSTNPPIINVEVSDIRINVVGDESSFVMWIPHDANVGYLQGRVHQAFGLDVDVMFNAKRLLDQQMLLYDYYIVDGATITAKKMTPPGTNPDRPTQTGKGRSSSADGDGPPGIFSCVDENGPFMAVGHVLFPSNPTTVLQYMKIDMVTDHGVYVDVDIRTIQQEPLTRGWDARYLLVSSDEERTEAARRYVEESIQYFTPEFLQRHTGASLSAVTVLCKNEEPEAIMALVDHHSSFERLVEDAISVDGAAHFLSPYDGEVEYVGDFEVYCIDNNIDAAHLTRIEAATVIQRWWRTAYRNRTKAASVIQRWFRHHRYHPEGSLTYIIQMRNLCDFVPTQVFVKGLDGVTFKYEVLLSTTVEEFKHIVSQDAGTPPAEMRLMYSGRELMDNNTLTESRVSRDSTVHLLLRLMGGGRSPKDPDFDRKVKAKMATAKFKKQVQKKFQNPMTTEKFEKAIKTYAGKLVNVEKAQKAQKALKAQQPDEDGDEDYSMYNAWMAAPQPEFGVNGTVSATTVDDYISSLTLDGMSLGNPSALEAFISN